MMADEVNLKGIMIGKYVLFAYSKTPSKITKVTVPSLESTGCYLSFDGCNDTLTYYQFNGKYSLHGSEHPFDIVEVITYKQDEKKKPDSISHDVII